MRAACLGFLLLALLGWAACSGDTTTWNVDGLDQGEVKFDSALPPGPKRPSCPASQLTQVVGKVLAPNGQDPVPGATVFIPSGVPEDFPLEIRCEVCSSPGSSALRWWTATSGWDGNFTLKDVCPGSYSLILQNGRFRRVVKIQVPAGGSYTVTADKTRLPKRDKEQSIHDAVPRIAVATGDFDKMECVLRKMGLDDTAFDLYQGTKILKTLPTKPAFSTLIKNLGEMKRYNIIFINCTADTFESELKNSQVVQNVDGYVKAGGRLYVTDWSYDWIERIPSLAKYIDFEPGVSDSTPEGENLAALGKGGLKVYADIKDTMMTKWLGQFGGAIQNGQSLIEHFLVQWVIMHKVPSDTKVWVEGVVKSYSGAIEGRRPLTVTFNVQNCGKVLFSSYHTEGRDDENQAYPVVSKSYPQYCGSSASPQDRILEYLIFDIANCVTPLE